MAVLYGGRSPDELLYAERARGLARALRRRVDVIVDVADADWRGRVGVVTALIAARALRPESAVAMICGPEVMMRFAAAALRERGVSDDRSGCRSSAA